MQNGGMISQVVSLTTKNNSCLWRSKGHIISHISRKYTSISSWITELTDPTRRNHKKNIAAKPQTTLKKQAVASQNRFNAVS